MTWFILWFVFWNLDWFERFEMVGIKLNPYWVICIVFDGGRLIIAFSVMLGAWFTMKDTFLSMLSFVKCWCARLFWWGESDLEVCENTFNFDPLRWVFITFCYGFSANWWIFVGVFTEDCIYKGWKFDGIMLYFYKDILLEF